MTRALTGMLPRSMSVKVHDDLKAMMIDAIVVARD